MSDNLTSVCQDGRVMLIGPFHHIAGELFEPLPSIIGPKRKIGFLRSGALRCRFLGLGTLGSHGTARGEMQGITGSAAEKEAKGEMHGV
jgi:hypothetical protein